MTAHESKIDPHEFDGQRVLVTGGTRGIGQAVAARWRDGGARALITSPWAVRRSCLYRLIRRNGYRYSRGLCGCGRRDCGIAYRFHRSFCFRDNGRLRMDRPETLFQFRRVSCTGDWQKECHRRGNQNLLHGLSPSFSFIASSLKCIVPQYIVSLSPADEARRASGRTPFRTFTMKTAQP